MHILAKRPNGTDYINDERTYEELKELYNKKIAKKKKKRLERERLERERLEREKEKMANIASETDEEVTASDDDYDNSKDEYGF